MLQTKKKEKKIKEKILQKLQQNINLEMIINLACFKSKRHYHYLVNIVYSDAC